MSLFDWNVEGMIKSPSKLSTTFKPCDWAESGSEFLGGGEVVTEICSQARTLESILIEANAPTRIDLLSIDVEGAELSVLKGVNFANWIFEYILIETTQGSEAFLELVNQGYVYLKSIDQNILFMHSSLANTKWPIYLPTLIFIPKKIKFINDKLKHV